MRAIECALSSLDEDSYEVAALAPGPRARADRITRLAPRRIGEDRREAKEGT